MPPASRDIYASTVAAKVPPGEARSVVVTEAEKLVAAGKMSFDQARTAAEAAGQCLEPNFEIALGSRASVRRGSRGA